MRGGQKPGEVLAGCLVVANHDRGPPFVRGAAQAAQQKRGSQLPEKMKTLDAPMK